MNYVAHIDKKHMKEPTLISNSIDPISLSQLEVRDCTSI